MPHTTMPYALFNPPEAPAAPGEQGQCSDEDVREVRPAWRVHQVLAACLLVAATALTLTAAQARETHGKVIDTAHGAPGAAREGSASAAERLKAEEIIEEPEAAASKTKKEPSASGRSARAPQGGAPVPAQAPAPDLRELRERLDQKLAEVRAAQAKGHTSSPRAPHKAAKSGAADTAHSASRAASHGHAAHWAYAGEQGPEAWGAMQSEFATCKLGQRQSPIDIRDGIRVDLEPIAFDYRPTAFRVIDNGHTVQINLDRGNAIAVMGRRFELVQFHFHRPSEERINGRQFAMVAHLVHKDLEGKLAVVAVLIDPGKANAVVQQIWNNLPLEKNEEQRASTLLDVAALLPENRTYYTYMGSLTTPPCSEGVLWMVLKQPVESSLDQIGIFSRLYPMNARPVQPSNGRLIKESN